MRQVIPGEWNQPTARSRTLTLLALCPLAVCPPSSTATEAITWRLDHHGDLLLASSTGAAISASTLVPVVEPIKTGPVFDEDRDPVARLLQRVALH